MSETGRKLIGLEDVYRRLLVTHNEHHQYWLRHLTTLAGALLTLLVVLQSSYVPADPQGLFLLRTTWIALAVSICAGVLVLYGLARTLLETIAYLQDFDQEFGRDALIEMLNKSNGGVYRERRIFYWAQHLQVGMFLLAVGSLTWFAVLNL